MRILLRKKISSNISDLNELNKLHWWIPNEFMIRPRLEVIKQKEEFSAYVLSKWMSFRDFILNSYFGYKTSLEYGHHFVNNKVTVSEWMFVKSLFPYDLPAGVHHYILWNSLYNCSAEFDEEIINKIIKDSLESKLNSDVFDFVWYVNPRPSIPELWHCQVFYICY